MTRKEAIRICTREKECVQSELDACADGGHYVLPDGIITAFDYVEAMSMAIAALREQESLAKKTSDSKTSDKKTSDWISVKDQRPEYKTRVLFVDESKRVWLAKDSIDWPDGGVSFLEPESGLWVRGTHWMPLPEPPKETT